MDAVVTQVAIFHLRVVRSREAYRAKQTKLNAELVKYQEHPSEIDPKWTERELEDLKKCYELDVRALDAVVRQKAYMCGRMTTDRIRRTFYENPWL
jgi:serine/threonine-protein kinase RIO1